MICELSPKFKSCVYNGTNFSSRVLCHTNTKFQMGKRKAGGRPFGQDALDKTSKDESRLRIDTYEDVADSEDEFHLGRDKILLEEGPVQKRQRKLREDGESKIPLQNVKRHVH